VLLLAGISSLAASTAIIAHRGASGLAPENTLAAFQKAVDLRADYFELDVQMSKDDSLVIMHDDTIDRTTDKSGAVSALLFRELRSADAGSWFSPEFAFVTIPTLSEALDLALRSPYPVGVVIEIKAANATIVDRVVAEVKKRNMQNRVIISSFTLAQIQKSKQLDPSIPVQLFGTITQANILQVAAIGGEWVGTSGAVTTALLDSAVARNMRVNKWTINSAAEMIALMNVGVHAITTNFPDIAKAVTDSTPPTDVILLPPKVKVTKVFLNWLPAEDAESGVAGYEIYRDLTENATTLLARVGDTTAYVDETLTESTPFYYRVKAVNMPGLTSLNFSNEVMATTAADQQPPKVNSIGAFGRPDRMVIGFNERVDPASAENPANYAIAPGITVSGARLALDSMSVLLTLSPMAEATPYTLTISQVQDMADTPNPILEPEVVPFTFKAFLPNTIAAWDMNEPDGTTLTDYSGNANHATLHNGLGYAAGQSGNGLIFDGVDDYGQVPASPSLDINGEAVSLSLWARLDYLPAELPGAYGPTYDSQADNYVIYEDKGNNELRFKVTTNKSAERPGIPAADLRKNVWLHLVGVYDGAKAMIYMNGQLKDSHNLTGIVKPGQIGLMGDSPGSYFKGSIDEIQIFNRALTPEEIFFLYKEAKTPIIDAEPPVLAGATSMGDPKRLYVEFSEPVDKNSAETIANYTIDNGISVEAAQLTVDGRAVMLTTSSFSPSMVYTVAVSGVEDMAEEPNVIAANSSAPFVHKEFPEGLVSYWLMDEGADTTSADGTANANQMFLRNGTEWSAGRFGNGLTFDGVDDYATMPVSPSLDMNTTSVTVSVWVKLNYLPANQATTFSPIYDSATDNYVIYSDKTNKELRFKVTTNKGAERPGIPAADLRVGEWLHVVGVYDGGSARIYLNGELKDVHAGLTGTVKPGQLTTLGKDGGSLFSGSVDHVQVFNRGLSRQEVIWLYTGIQVPQLTVEAISQTSVTLAWNPVTDPLNGISGYKVFRDTTTAPVITLATLGDTTRYVDETKSEAITYHYRVKSLDGAGIESPFYSNEVTALTGSDTTPPQLLRVMSTGEAGRVLAQFSEKVAPASATTTANYALDGGGTVDSVRLALDERTVLLYTSGLIGGTVYTLTVNQVTDVATTPNVIAPDSKLFFVCHDPLPGLVAYWPLDEGMDSTAVDVSGNGNHGKLGNAPLWSPGLFGNALSFNGYDQYVAIPQSASLNIDTSAVTLSLWIKLNYLPTAMSFGVGPIYDAPLDCYVIYEDKANKELRFKVTTDKGAERPGIPESKLTTGQWLHIVGVYDGTQAMIYLNGELMDTHPNLIGKVKPNQVARLGNDGVNYFSGDIDNVQVYRKALSADDIRYLYTGIKRSTSVEEQVALPEICSLSQNYPNPFNPVTTLSYDITRKGLVSLTVYDLLGRRVAELVNRVQEPGRYQVSWNATDLNGLPVSSGVYLCRLTTDNYTALRKMILVR
jgi:glycerophosphoryl diester phosphodiesterase